MLLGLACDQGPEAPTLDLPPRPDDGPGAAEIVRAIEGLDFEAREEWLYDEVARGNVPAWFRRLRPVDLAGEVDGRERRVTFWVAPDYLAVGSDDDFFFTPLSPGTALRIAELLGASLPTARMVDAVWTSARSRLVPIRIQPDEHMTSVRYFERHNRLVLAQRRRVAPGTFAAGHKLDVVLAATPDAQPGDVALYGWHLSDGTPIQPYFPVPADTRPHFSMGVRFVHRHVLVDGEGRDLLDVLGDPDLARLLGAPGSAEAAGRAWREVGLEGGRPGGR